MLVPVEAQCWASGHYHVEPIWWLLRARCCCEGPDPLGLASSGLLQAVDGLLGPDCEVLAVGAELASLVGFPWPLLDSMRDESVVGTR